MRFDICIPTKNSEKTIGTCLSAIEKTFRNKVNQIVVVDGYSSDKTVKIIESFKETLPIRLFFSRKKLGKVREFMIRKVSTEWFFFIDSDVIVNEPWLNKLLSFRDKRTGAIQGFALPQNFLLREIRKRKIPERGYTSNTLIRKESVEGIRLPNISRGEDDLIKKYIESRGFMWKYVNAYCIHFKPTAQILCDAFKDFLIFSKRSGILKALKI